MSDERSQSPEVTHADERKTSKRVKAGASLIGIMIMVLVSKTIPSYMRQRHEEQIFKALSPEKLVVLCGKPLKDERLPPDDFLRNFIYQGKNEKIVLMFMGSSSSEYMFVNMRGLDTGTWYIVPSERIDNLPCLDPK